MSANDDDLAHITQLETEMEDAAHRLVEVATELYGHGPRCQEKILSEVDRWYRLEYATVPTKPNGYISQALRKAVFERDEYRCCVCGSWIDLCIDHIHPLSKGGEATLENLQALCRSCNSRKRDKVQGA